ncbi:MAG: hypothetical protein IJA92_00615, partial [Oscillospiraceae bacterium]|nr:hypothetical protein [Oscillospiraceae bacterium]
MLLVSSIMMVSSTYAWFTLSTAPEVTGITTAVGANGNLEMALLPTDGLTKGSANDFGITSSAGDSTKDATIKNLTWGNLVDLSNSAFYGFDQITLYPAALNAATEDSAGNPTALAVSMLKTPTYGADGRVAELLANTVTSTYEVGEGFPQNSDYGVRAVGAASGMTDRQLAYRNALSAASTAMAQAKTAATASLNTRGASIANIALAHGTNADATHTQDDVTSLENLCKDLLGTDSGTGILEYIETAYLNYLIAYAASAQMQGEGLDDTEFKAFQAAIGTDIYSAESNLKAYLGDTYKLPTAFSDAISRLSTTKTNVTEALSGLESIDNTSVTWAQLSTPLQKIANTDKIKINDYEASTVKQNMSAIVNSVAAQGVNVTMTTGGGVYADIADHCGNYDASIVIAKVEYNGLVLENMNAKMKAETSMNSSYLALADEAVQVAEAPKGESGQVMPITDMYGFVIDLAFRTNASDSNLLLQTD